MEIKKTQLVVRGMQQDLSISKFNPEFSYENRNIRISAREDSSLLSITNERGNKALSFKKKKPQNKLVFDWNEEEREYFITAEYPVYDDVEVTCRWYDVDGEFYTDTKATLKKGTKRVMIEMSQEIAKGIVEISPREDAAYVYYSENVPALEEPDFEGFKGVCIGYAVLNSYIILFTHSEEDPKDRIYKVENLQDVTLMYEGNLNFSLEHLIETLPTYESEGVQKVYWTDGENQPRVINYMNNPEPDKWDEPSYYDFSPSMEPYSFIDVTKNSTGGQFAPGVIQYAFTYITDWHGVESNIVDTSSLNYISYDKRASKEDETCYNSFSIRLSGLDSRYKYIRVYSIHRTSLNTTPTVKVIGEYTILTHDGDPVEYWDLRNSFRKVVETLTNTPYSTASWYDSCPKLDPTYDSFVDAINTAFGVNVGTVGNGIFTLQEVFEYVWKQKSNYVELVDTGTVGTDADPTELLYKNSSDAKVSTMAVKDSTLFVGGYTIPSESQSESKEIKIYQEYGATVVELTWWTTGSGDNRKLVIGTKKYLPNGVASEIEFEVIWDNSVVPSHPKLLEGQNQVEVDFNKQSTGIKSIEIVKKAGQDYYQDKMHIYYLEGVDAYPPEDLILESTDGKYEWGYRDFVKIEDSTDLGTYTYTPYTLNNNSAYCKQFKKGQPYRFALQGQYANGRWGDPIIIRNLEDYRELFDKNGEIEDKTLVDGLYVMDNVCPVSFLIDPILSQEFTPQYTLTDVIETRASGTNYDNSNLITKFPPYSSGDKAFDVTKAPLPAGFWYFPTSLYLQKNGENIESSINKNTNYYRDLENPWKVIYNKDTFVDRWYSGDNIDIEDISNYIFFKTNYTVNGKYFFSLWAGNLNRPQTRHDAYARNAVPGFDFVPGGSSDAIDIPNDNFDGNFTTLYLNKLSVTLSNNKCKELYENGYRRVRLLYVIPTKTNRKYPAQGIVTNTVFLPALRASNSCWSYTDYLSRPKEVYRVLDEGSGFYTNWSRRVGEIKILNSSGNWETAQRMIASPFFYPFLHKLYSDYSDAWNKTWNMRPNYGHLMSTFHEVGSTTERLINSKTYFEKRDETLEVGYNASKQVYTPKITLESLTGEDNKKDYIAFDDNIVDFWSPDVEYQEVDKNYFENTVEGFQIRGMSCVVSTTNSNLKLKEDGSTFGLLGFSDASNYYPIQDLDALDDKGFSKETYTNTDNVSYLSSPQVVDVSAGVHRLYVNRLGNWSMGDTGPYLPHMWENLGTEGGDLATDKKDKNSNFSYKKYCLNTLMFKELNSLYYDINQPSLFIKGDTIKSISYYKTAYSGEDVTYNPGMDELLFHGKKDDDPEGTTYYNIPIQYKANTHLTFSLAKGETIKVGADGAVNREIDSFPVMPELSAFAKQHDSQQIIGDVTGKLYLLNLYWWPSKKSSRPDIYSNEAYSVSDSWARGEDYETYKLALEVNSPLPVDITVSVSYRLGFWKSSKESQLGRTSITLRAGQTSAIKKFIEDFTTLRDWSTINVYSQRITKAGDWTLQNNGFSATDGASTGKKVVVLVTNDMYINGEELTAADPYWLGNVGLYTKDMFDPIQEELLAPEYDNVGMQSIIYHRNLPHFLLIDLVRSDAFIYSDWTDSGLYQQVWVPCGKPVVLPIPDDTKTQTCVVEATEGDVFVGRYDCLRTVSDSEQIEKVNDIVSFICESYVNPDGRADVNRYDTDTRFMNFDNWNILNPVYSQENNFFNYTKNDYRILEQSGRFPNQFSWTLPKYPNNLVDNWTNLTFASTYNLDGEYGKLTKLVMHNNQLYAFQDKAISNILFNTRVQVPVSDGLPIELANSNKVDGVRYISTTSGAQNKWSIVTSRSGIYYIDNAKKNFNLISSEGIKEVTGVAQFTKWALNNLGYSSEELNLSDGMTNWKVSRDSIHDDVYLHDKNECLVFSERLANFTSFFDYKNVPFMFRQDGRFLSIYSKDDATTLYEQFAGEYNKFYDNLKSTSYVDYVVNPDMPLDKIFNNIEFRADAFSLEGGDYTKYVPQRTLDHFQAWNEFQDTGDVALKQYKNLQKKFRTWRAYIPRDVKEIQNYKLNRMRNPWLRLKLSYTPTEEEDNKLVLHNLIVNYTI